MNYRIVIYYICQIFKVIAAFLLLPMVVALAYAEYDTLLPFAYTILILLGLGFGGTIKQPENKSFTAKEGLAVVGLSWILISAFGALPFWFSREIPHYVDCFFEMSSGFTTTGASILTNVEGLSHSMLFWRSFSHWLGGMGVLVFILAILPNTSQGTFYLMKFESPGPQVGKLVSKLKFTARILYAIYLVMTVIEWILLLFSGIGFFDSMLLSFGTAGTGGFAVTNAGIGGYNNAYVDGVITVFMFLFGINFNLYYLLLLRKFKDVLKSEELRCYLLFVVAAVIIVTLNVMNLYSSFGEALRYSSFQVMTVTSTTGFATADFNQWPTIAKTVLFFCMFVGASAGSTAGGFKVSRIMLVVKSAYANTKKILNPRGVNIIKLDGRPMDDDVVAGAQNYFICYILIYMVSMLVLAFDKFDMLTDFSAVMACFNNIGPGFGAVGPMGNYSEYSVFSKLWLSLLMLTGRLEIFPILLLLSPKTWRKR